MVQPMWWTVLIAIYALGFVLPILSARRAPSDEAADQRGDARRRVLERRREQRSRRGFGRARVPFVAPPARVRLLDL